MILDKSLNGVLDQGAGCLVIYEEAEEDVRMILCFLTRRKPTTLRWARSSRFRMSSTVYTSRCVRLDFN